uniref:Uncharacterized protein n=1 Tax=Ciona savignyi TaxID=51511 RepID=H2YK86_CIOSA
MFKGKSVLITGASGSFGSAIAQQFSKESANIALTGRSLEKLNGVANKCKALGSKKVTVIVADLSKKEDLSHVIRSTTEKFARIDVLVNNAGFYVHQNLCKVEWEDIDDTFDLNVKAPLILSKLAMPFLQETKGCIVNISSVTPVEQNSPIVSRMSRGAVDQMTFNLACDFVRSGVRVNSVKPGLCRTNLTSVFSDEAFAKREKMQPLGGLLDPDNVADAVVFLSSPKASRITGQFLTVDAGLSVATPV